MAQHTPVLPDEVLAGLAVRADSRYCDATFGRGGHTAAILGALGPAGRVVAIDRDPDAIRAGQVQFAGEPRLTLVEGVVRTARGARQGGGFEGGLQGVLMDLGVSSPQLDEASARLQFHADGPLDMRMDNEAGRARRSGWHGPASARSSPSCARWARSASPGASPAPSSRPAPSQPIERTAQLAAIVAAAVPTREPGKHPATRTFQAIRIHVNGELDALEAALPQAVRLLAPGGRLA